MKYILLFCLYCIAIPLRVQSQEPLEDGALPLRYKMVSLNTTPLLVQMIPFNRANPRLTGPYNAEFHVFTGDRAFHTSLGFFLDAQAADNDDETIHLNFRIGAEKRRWTHDRWSFLSGWDLYFSAGGLNLIGEQNDDEVVLAGYGRRWSVEYAIQPYVRLSIETAMVLGLDLEFGAPSFVFIPPVALNLNFVIPRGIDR